MSLMFGEELGVVEHVKGKDWHAGSLGTNSRIRKTMKSGKSERFPMVCG